MKTIVSIAFGVVLLLLVAGCIGKDEGIFINLLDEDVKLEFRSVGTHRVADYPEIGPSAPQVLTLVAKGEQRLRYRWFQEVAVLDASGKVLFREVLQNLWSESKPYRKNMEQKIYFLIARDGAYPVRAQWQQTWRDHIREITSGFDHTEAKRKLIEAGLLKE